MNDTPRFLAIVALIWGIPVLSLFTAVKRMQMLYPGTITSWWRPVRDDLPGGAGARSKHPLGWAIDFVPHNPEHYPAAVAFLNRQPGVYAIDHVGTARHIHAQFGLAPLRNNPKSGV